MSTKFTLPNLQGTPEQTAAAVKIRENFFVELKRVMEKTKSLDRHMMKQDQEKAKIFGSLAGMLNDMEPVIIAHFSKITDARYWIENQNKKVEELLIKQVPLAMKEIK